MSSGEAPIPPLTLCPLGPADAPALQRLYQAAADYFQQASGALPYSEQAEHDLNQAAREDGRFLLGIVLQEDIIGVIDLRLAIPGPYDVSIGLILLAEPQRRQGLGSWSLRILEEWLRRATPTEALLAGVPAHDYAAQAFFSHLGFHFTGQATRIVTGEHRTRQVVLRKDLA